MRIHGLIILAGSLALAACSDEQAAKLQSAASAAIGSAHETLKNASQPMNELREHASAAASIAARVGDAAAVINPELKEQVDQLKAQASAAQEIVKAVQGK